ncbi:hypothetical protein Lesp02_35230 [Lentzea sp. NBRC 105346]|uniref:hypothetical protein n=1 Tax=Lentzea sp. NBRC 105346 TaxID=3032205 RepID=UPI0024A0443F|nr:hypothetical protein [Lentzea sp. NBRC 105346]GLZ31335.1 hypothetical protein Lesp02_35230 [Lentzea sp. NBRC 105346]
MRIGEAALAYLPHSRGEADFEVDWSAAPAPFKTYLDAERVPPGDFGALLRDLYGISRVRWSYPFGASSWLATATSKESHGFPAHATPVVATGRIVPSGGARYPSEVYVADEFALYHYDPAHHVLDVVRRGDHRRALTGETPELVLVLASTFWRTGFKYREFAYRPIAQDIGVLVAQALCLKDFRVRLGFDDRRVNALLGLDAFRETAMAVLAIGEGSRGPDAEDLLAIPYAQVADPAPSIATELPATARLHAAVLAQPADFVEDFGFTPELRVAQRSSPRNGFSRAAITIDQLRAILAAAGPDARCVVNRVTGLRPGAYDRDLTPLETDVSRIAHRWALWTRLSFHEAAAAVFIAGDIEREIAESGDRAVRVRHIRTGVAVHRAALAAAGQGLDARINSDGTTEESDRALGLTSARTLTMLLVGVRRPGVSLERSVP